MSRWGVSDRTPKALIRRIGAKVKKIKVGTNSDNNFNWNTYGNQNDLVEPYVPPQNQEASPREGGGSMAGIENMMQKRMRRFEATVENVKEMRSGLSGIRQKVDAYVVSIKHPEL